MSSYKKKTYRVDEWNGNVVFSPPGTKLLRRNLLAVTKMSWCFLHSNFSKRQSLSMAAVNLFDCFLPIDRKRYFEAQTTAFEVLRAIICLMQTGIFWWNGFSQSHLATRPVDPFQNQCSNCFFFFRFWCTRNIKFRKTTASFKAESKLSTSSFTEFAILRIFPQQQNVQMTHLALNWQLELNCGHQELCSWANGVLQNNNDLSRRNLHSPHPSPYHWPSTAPLVDISFSSQPSASIKTKNGGYNFRWEIN